MKLIIEVDCDTPQIRTFPWFPGAVLHEVADQVGKTIWLIRDRVPEASNMVANPNPPDIQFGQEVPLLDTDGERLGIIRFERD